ncbi:hypothetical protein [Microbacterium dauci]|uniref:Uncharacterized protein n=1 Tax=Microbacterium dauci TaxID=3048008 RepID=A0ABT6ZAQ5_9MICO|nr:hypothetical protein [Microbacterium sp. LX3-4]MDJ1113234.1 hypothetical protein [Microbacterium sp. LX3-4]
MSWFDAVFFPHKVSIRAYRNTRGHGENHAAAKTVAAEVRDEAELIRTPEGSEVVSSSRVTVGLDVLAPHKSLVTVWPGTPAQREATVLRVAREENPPPLPSHQILYLE